MQFPTYKHETQKFAEGIIMIAGCDEVGIGPIAGPVVAAAAILDPESIKGKRSKSKWWYRVRDSKTTDEKERATLLGFIKDNCLDFSTGIVTHETIDEINIYNAAQLAMRQAIAGLKKKPQLVLVDGAHKIRNLDVAQEAIVDGDAKILSISAASIIAKVARDKLLVELHETFPVYGFVKHKGYSTAMHKQAVLAHGVSPVHRTSFEFVQKCLNKSRSYKAFHTKYLAV